MFYVYLHIRPDGSPLYVGKGTRKRSHDFWKRTRHHKNIVAKHGKKNIQVVTIPAQSEEHAFWGEIEIIKGFRALGYSLCNITDGGEGASGVKQSAESIAKRVAKLKGKKCTAETRGKIGAANKGKIRPPAHIAATVASRKANAKPWKGVLQHSQETKDKIRDAKKEKPWSDSRKKESDARTLRIRNQLREALSSLMQTKSIQEISVREIVKAAGASSYAFYQNYHDKYALLESKSRDMPEGDRSPRPPSSKGIKRGKTGKPAWNRGRKGFKGTPRPHLRGKPAWNKGMKGMKGKPLSPESIAKRTATRAANSLTSTRRAATPGNGS